MKKICAFAAVVLSLCGWTRGDGTNLLTHVTFTPDTTTNFLNPERGFYQFADTTTSGGVAAVKALINGARGLGMSMLRLDVRIDTWINTATIDPTFISTLQDYLNTARAAGIKIIIVVSYNNNSGGADAPLNIIVGTGSPPTGGHVSQLGALWTTNTDIIAFEMAGYVGAFAEWHNSTNYAQDDYADLGTILTAMLAAQPTSRMIAVRYPVYLYQLRSNNPVPQSNAFNGTNLARTGFYNLGFTASYDDFSTWTYLGQPQQFGCATNGTCSLLTLQKQWIAQSAPWTLTSGEYAQLEPGWSSCQTALPDMVLHRYTSFDIEFFPSSGATTWMNQGCYDPIARLLGYRFQINDAYYQPNAMSGSAFRVVVNLVNYGFGSLYNPRPVEYVLSDGTHTYTLVLPVEPRFWQPNQGIHLDQTITLPTNMVAGSYSLYMWMPDTAAGLQSDSRYSVRFANSGIWSDTTGYNTICNNCVTVH